MDDSQQPPQAERSGRVGRQLDALRRRGQHELTRPGGLGDTAHGTFRRWCRRIWRSRGGGLYAVGFMVSFVYLEAVDILFDDVPRLFSTNWLSGEAIGFFVDLLVDTLRNMLNAFLWPVHLAGWQAPLGVALLVAMLVAFPKLVQAPLERWLFEGQPAPDLKAEKRAEKAARRREKKARDKAGRRAGRDAPDDSA